MQYYKNLCGKDKMVWLEVKPKDRKKFLKWAKFLGCVWGNGKEINPKEIVEFNHFSISDDGKLHIVPVSAWASKQPDFKNVRRCVCNFIDEQTSQISDY